jgi:hypothetical protein
VTAVESALAEVINERTRNLRLRAFVRILHVVAERRDVILRAWHDHFGNGSPF